jgi:hypothetical protein
MQKFSDGSFILDQPHEIETFRLLALRSRFKLEIATNMPFSSRLCTGNVIRKEIGSTTKNKKKLMEEFNKYLVDVKHIPKEVINRGKGAK